MKTITVSVPESVNEFHGETVEDLKVGIDL